MLEIDKREYTKIRFIKYNECCDNREIPSFYISRNYRFLFSYYFVGQYIAFIVCTQAPYSA